MSASLSDPTPAEPEFTGERFVPSLTGEIAYEHWHRYAFARRFAEGKRVLDIACGEGYGTALLGSVAASAIGVDIDMASIDHARATYGEGKKIRFIASSCTGLPLPNASIDVIVSFETIEHVDTADQLAMLIEFARLLTPGGLLVISSPNKRLYSDERQHVNPYHLQELYRDDLKRLLSKRFPAQRWYHQRLGYWSGIWAEREPEEPLAGPAEAWVGDGHGVTPYPAPEGMYFIVLAARDPQSLPAESTSLSLFTDEGDSELKRAQSAFSEVLRLDQLLGRNDAAFAEHDAHIRHLEKLVVERERMVEEREAAVQRHAAHVLHLEKMVIERDGTIVERDRALVGLRAEQASDREKIAAAEQHVISLEVGRTRLESERTRLETTLLAEERKRASLESFSGWIRWRLRRWLGRSR